MLALYTYSMIRSNARRWVISYTPTHVNIYITYICVCITAAAAAGVCARRQKVWPGSFSRCFIIIIIIMYYYFLLPPPPTNSTSLYCYWCWWWRCVERRAVMWSKKLRLKKLHTHTHTQTSTPSAPTDVVVVVVIIGIEICERAHTLCID